MPPNNNLQIGSNIRKWRSLKGFKQDNFARIIGTSKATLSKIENGKSAITIPRLQKIADSLNIKTMDLFNDPLDLLPPPR